MGKRLIQQARGKGGPTYRAPSFKYKGVCKYINLEKKEIKGEIIDIIHCRGHSSPLIEIRYENNEKNLMLAPEGIKVGDEINIGENVKLNPGNTLPLKSIPEGTLVHNIEAIPGDGGKFVRSSGTAGKILTKLQNKVNILLPSKKQKTFFQECRASIGVVAGSGRIEKPFLKAGKKFYAKKAKNKLYPIVSGSAQNAVDHPFGNSRSSRKSKARPTPSNAPPGRKVGMLMAKRTGRKKGKGR